MHKKCSKPVLKVVLALIVKTSGQAVLPAKQYLNLLQEPANEGDKMFSYIQSIK
jgi:hypothetical protein